MPHIDGHPAGEFCWFELGTSDQAAAKNFYSSLFGWTANDFPMGPEGSYTIFQLEGRDCAAAYTLQKQMVEQGIPPHWMIYVAVDSADASAAKCPDLGGKVLQAPFDVFDFGRMAVLQDPTGATFSIWEARKHKGSAITEVPGTMNWGELSTNDTAKAVEFYSGLFGWKMMTGEGGDYLHINNGKQMIGGIPPAAHRDPNIPPHWLMYFTVADCDASASKATSMGASLMLPPMTMEKVGRFGVIRDPQGAVFAIFQHLEA
jgi:hypothetical protein